MSGGGGTQTQSSKTTQDPWAGAQPALYQALQGLSGAFSQPPKLWGGPLTVGPTSAENAAWQQANNFNSGYFGGGGQYGQGVGANSQMLGGGAQAGYARSLAPGALSGLNQVSQMGPYALSQLGTAGNLDATGAIKSALSGTPDYSGLQGSIDAANAPILRDFNQNILPGLNSRATFLNNSTGGIKSLGNILPDLGQRLSENALGLTEQERQRALAAQQNAAGLVTQGGLQQNQLGLQAQDQFANQRLNLGQLLGSYAGQASNNQQAGIGNLSGLYNLGAMPSNVAQQYAAWDRGLQQNQLSAQQQLFAQQQNQPQQQAQQYAQSILPFAGVGGTQQTNSTSQTKSPGFGTSDALSLAGGLAGAYFGGPWGAAAGSAAGGALGGGGGGKGGGQPYQAGVDLSQAPNLWNNLGSASYIGSNIANNANYGY